jgi:putative oligomerization/nucleic acid binding protein/uncharacterized protein DUF3592
VRYWLCVIGGLLIAGASIVLIDIGIFHLVRTGTCGSTTHYGTTYSARPCPPGTGLRIVGVVGGVFGTLLGIGLFAARGGQRIGSTIGLGLIMWSLLFVTIPLSIAYAAFGPANKDSSGAKTTAIILSAVFIPMGLAPLPLALRGRKKRDLLMQLATQGQRCPGVLVSVEDTGVTVNDNPSVRMTVRAEPPGEAPFTIVKTATVSRVRIPRPGDRCVVFYDPAARETRNGITFDPVPGFTHQTAAPVAVAAASAGDDDDPLDKIAKLGELRDQGIVTAEEFEAQKKRLLDEL